MNGVLDNSLVGLALVVSVGYAVSSLGPRSVRRRALAIMSRSMARAPAFLGLRRAARWLGAASVKAQGACGGCDGCGSEQGAAQKPPAAEVIVPVANIGGRDSTLGGQIPKNTPRQLVQRGDVRG